MPTSNRWRRTLGAWMINRAHLARLCRKNGQPLEAEAVEAHLLKLLAGADPDFPTSTGTARASALTSRSKIELAVEHGQRAPLAARDPFDERRVGLGERYLDAVLGWQIDPHDEARGLGVIGLLAARVHRNVHAIGTVVAYSPPESLQSRIRRGCRRRSSP